MDRIRSIIFDIARSNAMTMTGFAEEKKDDGESRKGSDNSGDPKSRLSNNNETALNICSQEDVPVKSSVLKVQGDTKRPPLLLRFFGGILRFAIIDFPVASLFAAMVATLFLHEAHDKYLAKQIDLMIFQEKSRDFWEQTYYHRYCQMDDEVSATSTEELFVPINATADECVEHQMTHGVSVYRDLLTPETMHELREFIVEENKKQDGFYVIENEHRWSWGIDVNMHPSIKKYWKELGSNELLVRGIQAIVGPDPAIIEFTAITSGYGAKDQFDHQDVVSPGSGIKYAQSYMPSYSLFIPLQDTSYDMGATHVCPGSHLCADGAPSHCKKHNLAMSGEEDNWRQGWGALVNQQTTHKGMGHSKEGGLDRVVIICTFAPRPQTFRGLESRVIGQGGSYSIDWASWGHTFSDFINAEERMWEPLKTMRALGLVKGRGWNLIDTASMRMANEDNGYVLSPCLKSKIFAKSSQRRASLTRRFYF